MHHCHNFLGIHLRRGTFAYHTLQRVTTNKKIHFPLYFNSKQCLNSSGDKEAIESYNVDFNSNKNDKNESVKKEDNEDNSQTDMFYELYSIFIHDGGACGGHYYAYMKDFESGEWIRFNDSRVYKIPKKNVYKYLKNKTI